MSKNSFKPFPIIITKRLRLRKIILKDAKELFYLRSNEDLMKYLDKPKFIKIKEAKNFINVINIKLRKMEGIVWAITQIDNDKLIGTIGYHTIKTEHRRAEIGYFLHPMYQGQGIMQEAISAIMDYGFNKMNLHSIEANVNPNNEKSIKLLIKNKFIKEAHFKEDYYFNGMFLDSAIYSLLNKNN